MVMAIIPKFRGKIENGKILFENRNKFDEYLLTLEGEIEIVVFKPEKAKTLRQLSYYFGVCIRMIAEEIGESPEKAHKDMKDMHLKWVTPKVSVSQCTTVELKEYIDRIKMWAATEINLNIPDSKEIYI